MEKQKTKTRITQHVTTHGKTKKTADQFLKRLKTIERHEKTPNTADQFQK